MRFALLVFALSLLPLGTASAQSIQDAIVQLRSPDAEERAKAACTISRFRAEGASATAALIEILGDDSPLPRDVCRDILGRRGWYGSNYEGTTPAREASHALGHIGPSALGPLHDALDSDNTALRLGVVRAIGEIEDVSSVSVLARAMPGEPDAEVRSEMAWALGAIEDPAAVEALGVAIRDREIIVREQAAWGLGAIEARTAVPLLAPALSDRSPVVREMAAWALGAIEDRSAVAALVPLLGDVDPGVREQAAWALGSIGDEAASDALIALMDDRDVEVRRMAMWALSSID